MQNAISTFQFTQNKNIRAFEKDGIAWFAAIDVCNALEISNHNDATSRLDDDEKSETEITDSLGRKQKIRTLSESGLFILILRSRKAMEKGTPQHTFRKWVTAEVLPAIRKTGGYQLSDGLIDDYQKMSVQKAVTERTHRTGESHQAVYTKLHQFAGVPSYHRIKAADFERVMQFLESTPDTPAPCQPSEGLSERHAAAIAALAEVADRQYKMLELVRPILSRLTSPYTRQMDDTMQQTHHAIKAALQPVFDSPHGQSYAVAQHLICL